jgi:Ca2+-binding RTX toxin-like protein
LNFTVSQFENVIGSGFADTITGNISNNSLSGGGGNDTFFGSAGSDTINGGLANDTANYNSLANVVTLRALGVLNKGALGTDTLIGVESIIGSSLLGDTVDFSGASVAPATGTVANLTSGVVTVNGTAPLPLNFTVSQFENVIGSGFADTITGNISNNSLSGGGGNDTISGGNGADTITGGAGKDQLTGEAGIDVFVYSALADSLLSNFDIITDYSLGDILDRPGLAVTTLNSSSGIASGSSAAQVGSFLNNFIFTSNTSLAFSAIGSSGTFIAFNDATAGFNSLTDSILWLPNYIVSSTNTVAIV